MSEKRCPACGASVDINATECRYCGEALTSDTNQFQQANSQGYQQQSNYQTNYSSNNYQYLKPYYQEQFNKIEQSDENYKGKWNWCAFFFSWIWGLTKGLWALSILTLIASGMTYGVGGIVIAIIWGVRGNYFYYNLKKYNKQFPSKL